jgi:hypothetical protein
MISMIQRWLFGPTATFTADVPMMAGCQQCEKFITNRAANGLAVHLIYHHKVGEDDAYKTTDWVFTRLRDHLLRNQKP